MTSWPTLGRPQVGPIPYLSVLSSALRAFLAVSSRSAYETVLSLFTSFLPSPSLSTSFHASPYFSVLSPLSMSLTSFYNFLHLSLSLLRIPPSTLHLFSIFSPSTLHLPPPSHLLWLSLQSLPLHLFPRLCFISLSLYHWAQSALVSRLCHILRSLPQFFGLK